MTNITNNYVLYDYAPSMDDFEAAVFEGLSQSPKTLPCKFFYDERGSILFDQICEVDEYYPTRTELALLNQYADDIADEIGPNCAIIEYGSGSSAKVPILLRALEKPVAYVPIEISKEYMQQASESLLEEFPDLQIIAICADYKQDIEIPSELKPLKNRFLFFPGSTIGNFEPEGAIYLLKRMKAFALDDTPLLIGVDLKKDRDVLHAAYNDSKGVTAAFNMNLLYRINHELGGNFNLKQFKHEAKFNENLSRIEMHLVSLVDQVVKIKDKTFSFQANESIFTESSFKHTSETFAALAKKAGWKVEKLWTDEHQWFSIQLLRPV